MNSKSNKIKKFAIRDLDSLQKEFYKTYDPDYWLYKISLLKNCHDNFDSLKNYLTIDLSDIVENDYKKMLRTELHFLYFQMIETLFEIIFAVSMHDNRNLWLALTFSHDSKTTFYSDTYEKIKEFAEGKLIKPNLKAKIKTEIQGKKVEISLLRWIFYFIYPSQMSDEEWRKNLDNIEKLLRVFAKDFTDRGKYNAYKHSLRFYNSNFALSIGITGSQNMRTIGKANDAITYLEEHKERNKNGNLQTTKQIAQITKPFDFERDYRCCLIIYELIKNTINTRKYSLLEELHSKEFQFTTFLDIQFPEVILPKTGLTKFTVTV